MKLSDFRIGMDQYDRRARLMPALLVILPAALAVVALAPDAVVGWSGGVALFVQAGGGFLLAQSVGDTGKRKEPKLFEYFGGRPTELMLCHEHATNQVLLAERHRKLAKLFPKIRIPTAAVERGDPKAALDVYTACMDKVRGIVRTDKTKHVDVQRENIQYGFRRNLWAIKPWGISVTLIAGVLLAAEIIGQVMEHEPVPFAQPVIIAVDIFLLLAWTLVVTRDWIERAAFLYAERLLETLDTLGST
jgi:hypothetical protein